MMLGNRVPRVPNWFRQRGQSILGMSGVSYWLAGTRTDSQNLSQLGSSGAGDAQYGSTSGSDSNDPTTLDFYPTTDYDLTVDGVNYHYVSENLVTNGTFDTDLTGWTLDQTGGVVEQSGGQLRIVSSGSLSQAIQNSICNASSLYHITFDNTVISGTQTTNGGTIIYSSTGGSTWGASGAKEFIITGITGFGLKRSSASEHFYDNVVVREVAVAAGPYVYLPGTAGNYVSSPDSAAVSVTGDITLTVQCALTDWTSGSNQALISKSDGLGTNTTFLFRNSTTGTLQIYISNDGATEETAATGVHGFIDGETKWIRFTYDATATTGKFFTSVDGVTWSQLGSDQTGFTYNSLFDSTMPIEVGTTNTGANAVSTGKFYYASIHDNATGTGDPVWEFDASLSTQGGYTDAVSGDAITINRTSTGLKSTLVTRPVVLFNSAASTYLTVADHADLDMGAGDDFTVWWYGRQHTWAGLNGVLVSKKQYISDTYGGYAITTQTTPRIVHYLATGGEPQVSQPIPQASTNTANLISQVRDTTADTVGLWKNSTLFTTAATDITTGSMANAIPLKIGTDGSGTGGYSDMEVWAFGIHKGVGLTAAQLTTLKEELDVLLGGSIGE